MQQDLIVDLFHKFEQARYINQEIECWSARKLQKILGYTEWRNFLKVIEKGKTACETAGLPISHHFVDVNIMITLGKGGQRVVEDLALTRYACFLIAQNGDPSKSEIAFAQTYFAVQTRKQEVIERRLLEVNRLSIHAKFSKSTNKLSNIVYERGVDEEGFEILLAKGQTILFGGHSMDEMKKQFAIPEDRTLVDFLPTLTVSAMNFANELTSHSIVKKNLLGQTKISAEHDEINRHIREILVDAGVKPETLPLDKDIREIQGELKANDKKKLNNSKKGNRKSKIP